MDQIETCIKAFYSSTHPADWRVERQEQLQCIEDLAASGDPRAFAFFLEVVKSRRVLWNGVRIPILNKLHPHSYSEIEQQQIGQALVEALKADHGRPVVRYWTINLLSQYRDTPEAVAVAQAIVVNANGVERILSRYAALGVLTGLSSMIEAVIGQLIAQYKADQRSNVRGNGGTSKTEIVEELAVLISHPLVLEFFLQVVADSSEYDLARIEILKLFQYLMVSAQDEQRIGQIIAGVIRNSDDDYDVRLWATNVWESYEESASVSDAHEIAQIIEDEF